MIKESEIIAVGKVNKTHGINGEMSVSLLNDAIALQMEVGTCVFFRLDGIFVPFFIGSVRPRGNESLLLKLDGEDSQEAVAAFVGMDLYVKRDWLQSVDTDEEDGLYAAQLIGFNALTEDGAIGEIIDVDDNTENPLFIIKSADTQKTIYIPIVDDFIEDISMDDRTILFDLPDGLLDL